MSLQYPGPVVKTPHKIRQMLSCQAFYCVALGLNMGAVTQNENQGNLMTTRIPTGHSFSSCLVKNSPKALWLQVMQNYSDYMTTNNVEKNFTVVTYENRI